jgi:hypothetical protein
MSCRKNPSWRYQSSSTSGVWDIPIAIALAPEDEADFWAVVRCGSAIYLKFGLNFLIWGKRNTLEGGLLATHLREKNRR